MLKNNYLKVKGHDNLVKDVRTGAILNTDLSVVRQHEERMKQVEKEKAREQEINNIKSDINELKSSIGEIKELLVSLSRKE